MISLSLFLVGLAQVASAQIDNPCSSKLGRCLETRNVSSTESNPFASYISTVYDVAVDYTAKDSERPANQLVMEFLRHETYNDFQWKALIGGVDDDWIEYAEKKGLKPMATFPDPTYTSEAVETDHLFATMNGVYLKGATAAPGYNRGDVAGWLGDLFTFYGEWRDDNVKDGFEYCVDNLAKPGDSSTFKLLDMIEDADGYNIATELKADPDLSIADVIEDYYGTGGGYLTRFSDFYMGRFGGDTETAKEIVCNGMVPGDDVLINAGRTALIYKTAGVFEKLPFWLSDDELGGFCEGFVDVLTRLAAI